MKLFELEINNLRTLLITMITKENWQQRMIIK